MKTLTAQTLKAKKDNLRAEFEKLKKGAKKYDQIAQEATKKRDECLSQMSSLQGAYKVVEDLEKSLSVKKTTKPKAKRSRKKK